MKTQSEMLPQLPKHLKKNLVVKTKLPHDIAESAKNLLATDLPNNKKVISVYSSLGTEAIKYECTLSNIVTQYCNFADITFAELSKRTRVREIVEHRKLLIRFMCKYKEFIKKFSLDKVGSMVGGYHHSSIIHHNRDTQNIIDTDIKFRYRYERMEKYLKEKFYIV
jgi:chromosomal replication initiation ATPase DnaA